MMPTMYNKPLYIPESKKWKGLTVYCYQCKTNVSEICRKSGKSLKQCPNGDRHVYKVYVHVPGTKKQRRTKVLETRDLNEAIRLAIEFEKEVKGGLIPEHKRIEPKVKERVSAPCEPKPVLLVHAMARYIGFLNNENVPAHLRKERSREHIKDVERAFIDLVKCLKDSGYNLDSLSVDDINDDLVGKIFTYLENRKLANRTFNKYFSFYTSFLKWYGQEYEFQMRNWFERVNRKRLNPNPEAITFEEYEKLLKQITPENGIRHYNNGVKPQRNIYRPWLADGIKLGLETGRRTEEIINLKWNSIEESEEIQYIKIEDFKVNHIQKRNTVEEKKFIFIPVTDSLRELLTKLGYDRNQETDAYILAPDVLKNRKNVVADVLCRGFSHYYEQLETGRHLTFKSLRKTYITNMRIFLGSGDTRIITGHSDNQVIENNYIDKKVIAKATRGFKVFRNENGREDELKDLRKETKNTEPEPTLNR